jgi:hypothetical protein
MKYEPSAGIQLDPDSLERTIEACEYASSRLFQILRSLRLHGESAQEWARDAVSLDIASYYTQQLYAGANCTYSTINNYHEELLSAIRTLRQTLADYQNVDTVAADLLEKL